MPDEAPATSSFKTPSGVDPALDCKVSALIPNPILKAHSEPPSFWPTGKGTQRLLAPPYKMGKYRPNQGKTTTFSF